MLSKGHVFVGGLLAAGSYGMSCEKCKYRSL